VYWRLRILKYCINNDCDPLEKVNIDAIIKAYIEGSPKVDDETATIWYGGKLLVGPIRANLDEALEIAWSQVTKWKELYGPSRIWVEEIRRWTFC
jgi:hypothetical protein